MYNDLKETTKRFAEEREMIGKIKEATYMSIIEISSCIETAKNQLSDAANGAESLFCAQAVKSLTEAYSNMIEIYKKME